MDLMQQLGALALASRLKRLAERLQRDVSQVYGELNVEFEARWFAVVYYLKDSDPAPLTTVAADLGLTHPAVNQVADVLTKKGLLESTRDSEDERRRLLGLTTKGKETVRKLEPVWAEISAATAELAKASGVDILRALERMERSLDDEPMYDRVKARLEQQQINA